MTPSLGQPTTLERILEALGPLVTTRHLVDATTTEIRSVNSPADASAHQIAFVTQSKYLEKALTGSASALCFPESARELVTRRMTGPNVRPYFFSHEPELAMRQTIQTFFQTTPYTNRDFDTETKNSGGVHPTAIVHSSAKLAAGIRVGPYCVISSGVTIEDSVVIGAHTVIESNTKIGPRSVLHPFVYVGPRCDIGADCEINPHTTIGKEGFGYAHDKKNNHYRIPHTGRVIIGDRVHLGSSVNVDRGTFADTEIRSGAILDNRIQISHNAVIGENAVITAGFVVAGSTKIGRNFLTGGNTSVTGHIELCDNVNLAALSVVRKSITKPGAYGGNPLLPMRDYIRFTSALSKLPELFKKLQRGKGDSSTFDTTDTSDSEELS